jgi:hypothetical protein
MSASQLPALAAVGEVDSRPVLAEVRPGDRRPLAGTGGLPPEVVAAFSPIAEAGGKIGVDELLELVAQGASSLLGVSRCALYLRNEETGLFEGRHGRGAPWVAAAIVRTICGQECDGLTREIVATRRAVPVSDARHDSRPVRSAVLAWGVRSLLGVPITDGDTIIGLIFVDDGQRAHAYDQRETELLERFADVVSGVIARTLESEKLRDRARELGGHNRALQVTVAFGDRLAALVAEGGGLDEVAATVVQFTGKACAIYDRRGPCLALASPPGAADERPTELAADLAAMPDVTRALAEAKPGRATIVAPAGRDGREHRLLALRAPQESPEGGTILLEESRVRLRVVDASVLRRATSMVDVIVRAELYKAGCLRSLASDLLLGRDDDGLSKRAAQCDVDLAEPHVVCVLAGRNDADDSLSASLVAEAFGRVTGQAARLVVEHGSQVVVITALDAAEPVRAALRTLKDVVARALALLPAELGVRTAGLSSPCRAAADYPHALVEARHALGLDPGSPWAGDDDVRITAADDLGAGQLLTIGADAARAARFARSVLAPLLDDATPAGKVLMETLNTFFACSRNIRQTAHVLGVHENTIRYRLGSVMRRTGLDVAGDARDELTIQLALQFIALPVVDDAGAPDEPQSDAAPAWSALLGEGERALSGVG